MKRLVYILLFSIYFLTVYSAPQDEGLLRITKFTSRDHKANRVNLTMLQNKKGIIYFGNSDGVLEYDGFYWNTIVVPNKTPVRSLAESKSGILYVGTIGEFGCLRKDKYGKLEYYSLSGKLNKDDQNFLDVYKAHSIGDSVFFVTEDRLYCAMPGDKVSLLKHFTSPIYSYQVGNEIYFADTKNRLFVLKKGKVSEINIAGKSLSIASLRSMLPISQTEILLYLNEDNFYIFNKSNKTITPTHKFDLISNELRDKFLYSSCKIEDNYFAFGTTRGLFLYNSKENQLRKIDTSTGLTDDGVNYLMVDREKNLWVLNQMGINCIETSSPFTVFNSDQGLKGAPYSMLRFNGILYVATDYSTFYLENGLFKPVKGKITESWGLLNFKVSAKEQKLLVGASSGIFEIKKDVAIPIIKDRIFLELSQSYADPSILLAGLYETKSTAIFQYKNKKWKQLDSPTRLTYQSIKAIQLPSEQIWINNYYKGYSTVVPDKTKPLKNRNVFNFNESNGLPQFSPYSLMFYYKGRMIFSNENGLLRFNNQKNVFERDDAFGINKASKNKGIVYLCWDEEENATAAFLNHKETEIGISTKLKNNLHAWDFVSFRRFSNSDICTMYAEKDLVWLATTDGLIRFNRKKKRDYNAIFYTLLRKVTCHQDSVIYYGNDDSIHIKRTKPLSYNYNNIMFQVSSTFFEKPKQTCYSFFLVGHSKKWSDWSTINTKEYSNLQEGQYVLKIRSRNIYGVEGIITSYSFEILPPLYRTSAAYFFYVIGAILLFYLLNTLNSRRLSILNRKLEIKIKKRTLEIMKKNKLLEEQKAEIHEQAIALTHANETKDKFFSIIAHDLRSPFNGIIGLSTLMKQYYDDFSDTERKGFIDEIDNSARRTLDMLNDLLTWARAQNKRIDVEKEILDVSHIAENVLYTLLPTANRKSIELINLTTPANKVYADRNTLNMVITNLVNNAIKFTPDGGKITVSACEMNNESLISVSDTGVGIPPENIDKIFRIDVNFSTPGTHNESGTGLGLILCKEFVELNDGQLTVESQLNAGTTFTIHLPKHT